MTTTTITTCAADQAESLLWNMKEYLLYLILTTKVLNLLLRCYRNYSVPPQPGEGGRETEEDKFVRYPKRALYLLRDMKSIRDQAKVEETGATACDDGGGK